MSEMVVPDGWEVKKLGECISQKPQYGAGSSSVSWSNELVRYVRITDIQDDGKLDGAVKVGIPQSESIGYLLDENDVLIARTGNTVGKSYLHRDNIGDFAFAGYLVRFKTDITILIPEFLFQFTLSGHYWMWIKGMSRVGAQPNINATEYSEMLLPIPPLPEQQKIASILTSVDEVIEKTQCQINKLQDLKKGTMNELLTRGIGHTEFKDSPVGKIPVGWEVVTINDSSVQVLDGDRGKEYPKENDFSQSGYCLFLSAKNVTKNGFRFAECSFVSKDKDEQLRKGRLSRGDIVITTRGTVGNMAYFNDSVLYDVVRINSGMAIIRNDDESLQRNYFFHLMRSSVVNEQLELLTFGSAQPQLTIGVINSLKLPVPPLPEQQEIASILSSMDSHIEDKERKLEQTQSLKKSLMQDLLTGKVRVSLH